MTKCKMVMALPLGINADLVAEMITAMAHFRYDGTYGRDYEETIEPSSFYSLIDGEEPNKFSDYYPRLNDGKNYYFIEAEYVTLEMIDVIEDVKKLLPLEIYFEAGEPDGFDSRGEVYDHAIFSLYFEDFHDRRKSA